MPVTASVGGACAKAGAPTSDVLVNEADAALYRAKRSARPVGRVCIAHPPRRARSGCAGRVPRSAFAMSVDAGEHGRLRHERRMAAVELVHVGRVAGRERVGFVDEALLQRGQDHAILQALM